jgi:hypothetical protein
MISFAMRNIIPSFILSFVIFALMFSISSAELPDILGIIRSDTTSTNFGYRIVPLGDQNSDGFDDILIWDYRYSAYIYYGWDPFDTIPFFRINNLLPRISNIGDVDGNGYDDISSKGSHISNNKLSVYYCGDLIDDTRDLWFGIDTLTGLGYTVNGHDINRNGNTELISPDSYQDYLVLFELGLESDSLPDLIIPPANIPKDSYAAFGEAIAVGDFNGDGVEDLAANLRPKFQQESKGSVYIYFGDPSFDTIPDMIINRPGEHYTGLEFFGRLLENLGDINGDNYDDLYIGSDYGEDSLDFIYFGGSGFDTIPDLIFFYDEAIHVRSAGDLNNDDYNDIIVSYHSSWQSLGHVHIYLGGPNIDSIPDLSIFNNDIDGYQVYFGMDCAGIGDFNGDGLDDYAFSAIDGRNVGHVYICSGWDESTNVTYENIDLLPEDFQLDQNYPNPFNISTRITYEIPRTAHVKLEIINIVGQVVATLLNQEEPPGIHSLLWDGTDNSNTDVASGIYFYRLISEEYSETRKMSLLK